MAPGRGDKVTIFKNLRDGNINNLLRGGVLGFGMARHVRKIVLGDEFTDEEVIAAVNDLYGIAQDFADDQNPGPCTHEDGKDLLEIAEALDNAADDPCKANIKKLEKAMIVDTAVREYIPTEAFEIIIKLGAWK